jgi:hypothetical protein
MGHSVDLARWRVDGGKARHVLGGLDLLLKKADAVYPAADVDLVDYL